MTFGESLYLWLVPMGIVIGHLGIAAKVVPKVHRFEPAVRVLALVFGLAVLLAWSLRFRTAGHLPMFGTYESALSLALVVVAVSFVWERVGQRRIVVTPLAALTAAALLSQGRGFDPTPYALTISERSWVVEVHAILAWLAFAVLAVNSFAALRLFLARDSDTSVVERWLVVSLQIGFLVHTTMLASGSIYKFLLFGTAWSFDPIESLGLTVWLGYGTLLHLHLLNSWTGKKLARWCLGVFVLLVVSYRCIVYFPPASTYHILDIDKRIHVGPGDLGFGGAR